MQIKTPTLKHTFYFIFSLSVICLIWYGRGYFYDEAPDPGREAFYAGSDRHIPDETNVAVAISGLNAPLDKDIIHYGRTMIDASDILNVSSIKISNEIKFVGLDKKDEMDCALQDAIEYDFEHCTNQAHISALLEQNKLLLNRYFSLYKIADWQGFSVKNGQIIINLNRLLAAQNKLLISQGKVEDAYQLWRDNHVLISRVLGQENSMIERAIFQVVDGINLDSLEYLLHKNPETALTHGDELNNLLKPQGLTRYNLKDVMRAEYTFFNNGVMNKKDAAKAVHVEYMRNRLYRAQLEFLHKAQMPAPTLNKSQRELKDKYAFSTFPDSLIMVLPHGLSHVLINQIISGTSSGLFLVQSMHRQNAKIILLNLSIKIRIQNIDANHIQTFFNKASKEYNCPFTERPMVWDAVKKTIYCKNPEEKERVAEVRL